MAGMQWLSDSHPDPGAETSSVEAVLPMSPESPSQVRGQRIQSHKSDASSSDSDGTETEEPDDVHVAPGCFYVRHLISLHFTINEHRDYFLLEHSNSCRLNPCSPLVETNPDEMVLAVPVKEELPFDQVDCLQLVNLRDELLSPHHIRLLKLYPSTSSCLPEGDIDVQESLQLHCEAYQACLKDLTTDGQPLFAAASYVCGDQTPTRNILCHSDSFGVGQNAYDALLHMRFKDRPRLVWIDCLSIKQDDDREKSHQVGMLHAIYAQSHVVSWLGDGRDLDLPSMSFNLTLFARMWTEEVRDCETGVTSGEIATKAIRRVESHLKSSLKDIAYENLLQDLISIFARDYFDRVWIVQEIILGKTNVCQLGSELYPVGVLAAATWVLGRFEGNVGFHVIQHAYENYFEPALFGRWWLLRDDMPHDYDVVTSLNKGTCLDPRDYIYGVASLFEGSDPYETDYTLSEAEVYSNFAFHCLVQHQGIDVLNQDRLAIQTIYADREPRPDLPSWCPDWSGAGKGKGDNICFEENEFDWQASGTHEFVYSRLSRVTLALKRVVVTRIKLRDESLLKWVNGKYLWIWFEHREHSRAFIKPQGLRIDHDAKDAILRIFERILPPGSVESWHLSDISPELRLLFDQVGHDRLMALLTPVYLAAVDPELLKAVGLEIDARIPLEDYPSIRNGVIRHMLSRYGQGTRLFVTENGMQGAGYPDVRSGDLVCIIYGSNVPQVLRQVDADDDDHYILVGACNVDGLMYGEGLKMGLIEQEFILV
jgi:hypothetical protein